MRTNKKKLNPVDFVKAKLGTTLVRKPTMGVDEKGKKIVIPGKPVGANEIHVFARGDKKAKVISRGVAE